MLPPPFLILPQAEINFNYFPSLAHDECQDNEALTLNKYVALGMCLVEQRTRAACAWWGLGWSCCSSGVAGEHHWRASFRVTRLDPQHGMALERSMASPVGKQPCLSMDLWNWEDWGSKGGGHRPMGTVMVCLVKGLLVPRAAWKGS